MSVPNRRRFLATSAASLPAATYAHVPGANDRVGVGLIGYGLMGSKHLVTFRDTPGCDALGVSDVHAGRLAEGVAATKGAGTGHADFRKLLDDKRVNGVIVATPDHWHAPMALLACAAGKDVYVEKPMTLFVREGQGLVDVAAKTKRVIQVGTQQRSGKHYQRARQLLRDGHIGTIHSVRISQARNVYPGFGSPPDRAPPPELDWDQWLGPAPKRPYNPNRGLYHFRWFWDTAGGQMTNLTSHELDIVDWVLGLHTLSAVTSVGGRFTLTGAGETPDTQDTLFRLEGQTVATSMRECSRGPTPPGLEFFGTKGSLAVSRAGFTVTSDADDPPVNRIPGVATGHPAGGAHPGAQTSGPRTEPVVDRTGSVDDQYREHAKNFLECVRTRKAPNSDVASGHRVATACHLANLSLRLGRTLMWDGVNQRVVNDPEANAMLGRPYRAPWDREIQSVIAGNQ